MGLSPFVVDLLSSSEQPTSQNQSHRSAVPPNRHWHPYRTPTPSPSYGTSPPATPMEISSPPPHPLPASSSSALPPLQLPAPLLPFQTSHIPSISFPNPPSLPSSLQHASDAVPAVATTSRVQDTVAVANPAKRSETAKQGAIWIECNNRPTPE